MPASTGKSVNGQQAAAIAAGQGYGDQGAMAALSAASSNAYDPALSSSSLPSVFAQHPSVQLPPIRYPPPGANLSLAPLLQAASAADFDASKNLFAQPAFQNSSVYGGGAEDVAVKEKRTGASGSGERKSEEKEEEGEEVNAEEGSARQLKNTKRAAQNRAAQRAFRERKEQYVRDLERKSTMLDETVARERDLATKLAAAEAFVGSFDDERSSFLAEQETWAGERAQWDLERERWAGERDGWKFREGEYKRQVEGLRGALEESRRMVEGKRAREEEEEEEEEGAAKKSKV